MRSDESSGQPRLPTFSLVCGGPLFRLLSALRLTGPKLSDLIRGAAVFAAVAWLPLCILAAVEGRLLSTHVGFVRDFGAHARLLIALPLLLVADRFVDRRFAGAVRYLDEAGYVDASNRRAVSAAIARADAMRDSAWAEGIIALALIGASLVELFVAPSADAAWMYTSAGARTGHLSLAGIWYLLVGALLYRFVIARWLWRMINWTILLARLIRAPLELRPAHPDRLGGLSVIVAAHHSLGWLILALGTSLAGYLTTRTHVLHQAVTHYRYEVVGFLAGAPLMALAPLLVLSPALTALRRRSHQEYGAMAAEFARRFHRTWLQPGAGPMPIDSPVPSSHTDMTTSFDRSVEVRRFAFRRTDLIYLFLWAAVPMFLFIIQGIPLSKIAANLRKIVG